MAGPEQGTPGLSMTGRWEVGSEFHWQGLPKGPFLPWPEPTAWYQLGRHAVLALLNQLGEPRVLWLPRYFCQDVARGWAINRKAYYYDDHPCRSHPDWATLTPKADDIVIAVNYFGMRDGSPWAEWVQRHDCILVEDHSHDPHSPWARRSGADYAFGSLRKVFPVPDGAVLWSPKGHPLPPKPQLRCDTGCSAKLAAMLLKAEYLAGRGKRVLKETFRRLQISGEGEMETAPVSAPSPLSFEYLSPGGPLIWRRRRRNNALHLMRELDQWEVARPIFSRVPRESAPFGVVLAFMCAAARDSYREKLRRRNIYCPIHWAASPDSSTATRDLASRILTIPCDHRYTTDDMQRVAEILRGKRHAH